jgi:ubiquinol-cytochrome c reductase cytochrome b subunit
MPIGDRSGLVRDHGASPFRRKDGRPWGSSFVGLFTMLRRRAVPNRWSSLLSAISTACLAVLMTTGVFLTIYYTPSNALVSYSGPYQLLRGVQMSAAFESTMRISFEVRGGLLMRQAHHWAALLLPAVLLLRILDAFFTGRFRQPRRWQWVLLFGMLVATLLCGWSGYALPDDLLAGTGLRIFQGVVLGIPLIGTALSTLIFGGEFPGTVLANLYPIHVIVAPAGLVLLAAARLRLAWNCGPPQFLGPGRTADNVVGPPAWPTMANKWSGMFLITVAVIVLNAGLVEISPVWRQGPSSTGAAGAGSQPDWYTAFLDGALRLVPPDWELTMFGRTWTLAVIVPLLAVSIFFVALLAYPHIEQWITGDHADHHLLDRPRDTPARTGIGVAGMVFYGTLWAAGSADLIATQFQLSFNVVIHTLQVVVLAGPGLGFLITYSVCCALQDVEREQLVHGVESGQIVRLPSGGYVEKHQPLRPSDRFIASSRVFASAPEARRNHRGKITPVQRFRGRVASLYLADTRWPQSDEIGAAGTPATPGLVTSDARALEPPGDTQTIDM